MKLMNLELVRFSNLLNFPNFLELVDESVLDETPAAIIGNGGVRLAYDMPEKSKEEEPPSDSNNETSLADLMARLKSL